MQIAVLTIFVVATVLAVAALVAWSLAVTSAKRAIPQIDPSYASRLFRAAESQYLWRHLPVRTSVLFDGAPRAEVASWITPLQRLTRTIEVLLVLMILCGAVLV